MKIFQLEQVCDGQGVYETPELYPVEPVELLAEEFWDDDPEPDCTCTQTDVDIFDPITCEYHNSSSAWNARQRSAA